MNEIELLTGEDFKNFADTMILSAFKSEQQIDVICGRAEGKSQEELAKMLDLDIVGVQKIEDATVAEFLNANQSNLKKFFESMNDFCGGKNILTFDDAKNLIGETTAQIIWFFASKLNAPENNFYFANATRTVNFVVETPEEIDYSELIKDFPKVLSDSQMQEKFSELVTSKKCSEENLRTEINKIFNRSEKFFYKSAMSTLEKLSYVLREKFPQGYKVADEIFYSRFLRYLREFFGGDKILSRMTIDLQISSKIGVPCDKSMYMHPDFVNVPQNIVEMINNFVESSPEMTLTYKAIFDALKDKLAETQIKNHYFLHGVMKVYNAPYNLTKDSVCKGETKNNYSEIDKFIKKRGFATEDELKNKFPILKGKQITIFMANIPDAIFISKKTYIHSSRLNLTADDYQDLEKFLPEVCNQIPASSRLIFNLLQKDFSDFLTRNQIDTPEKLFGILRYMFGNKFSFSRQFISTTDISNLDSKKILLMHLKGKDKFSIADFLELCNAQGIYFRDKTTLIYKLMPEIIRIDKDNLAFTESIGITKEITQQVVDFVKPIIAQHGGWLLAKNLSDFQKLPTLKVDWNSFLIESIVDISGEIKILHTIGKLSSAIFISDNFADDNFESFLLKILINQHKIKPFKTKADIFNYLQAEDLIQNKLPKFLISEGHIKISGDGSITLS